MTKIAVEISGLMRGFHKCIPSWKHILNSSDCEYDFFVSTYDVYGYNYRTMWDYDPEHLVNFELVRDELEAFGNVVSLQIKSCGEESRYTQMFARINEAHQSAKKEKQEYLFVLRTRPDLFFTEDIEIRIPDRPEAIFPTLWGFAEDTSLDECRWTKGVGLCDQFAVCGLDAMETYSNIINDPSCSQGPPEGVIHKNFQHSNSVVSHQEFKQCVLSRNQND